MVQFRDSQSVVPRLAILASSGNLLDMQIIRPHLRSVDSETLEVGPNGLCFKKLFK